jgi:hypothetical protein
MAKKVQPPEPEAPISLAEAIRGALWSIGITATKSEVGDWIKKKYPSLEYKDSTLNSSLSSIRKRLLGEEADAAEPTLKELLHVQEIAREDGGVDAVIALLDKVEAIARKVGGMDRLRVCLKGLKSLTSLE